MSIVIDSYTNTSTDASQSFSEAGVLYAGTSFRAINTRITSCKFYLNGSIQNGSLYAQLYAHTGTYGQTSGVPTGSPLATSAAVQFVDGTPDWREFTFSGDYTLEDDYYCIIVHFDGMSGNDNLSLRMTLNNEHDGMEVYSEDGSTWTPNSFFSVSFYVYGDPLPRIGDEYPLPPYARN